MGFSFSQLMSNTSIVSGWAQLLILVRFPKEPYMNESWHLKGYTTNFPGGVHIGSGTQTNFKLQLIM